VLAPSSSEVHRRFGPRLRPPVTRTGRRPGPQATGAAPLDDDAQAKSLARAFQTPFSRVLESDSDSFCFFFCFRSFSRDCEPREGDSCRGTLQRAPLAGPLRGEKPPHGARGRAFFEVAAPLAALIDSPDFTSAAAMVNLPQSHRLVVCGIFTIAAGLRHAGNRHAGLPGRHVL
jgi:hypothetical protein